MSEQVNQKADLLWWLLAGLLLVGGLSVSFYFPDLATAIKLAGWLVLALIVVAVVSRTTQGTVAWGFIGEAKRELNKVVWPSWAQTMQSTLVVSAMVIVTALVLWGMDSILMWAIGWVTAQRG